MVGLADQPCQDLATVPVVGLSKKSADSQLTNHNTPIAESSRGRMGGLGWRLLRKTFSTQISGKVRDG
jgi:hypothetical protein